MNKRKLLSVLMLFAFVSTSFLPSAVIAQGGGIVVTKINSFSVPSQVTKNTPFSMSASVKNVTNALPDSSYHIPMRLDSCTLATQKSTNPNQNGNNIQLHSFSPVVYNGVTYQMDIQQGSLGGIPTVMPRTQLILESGDSITLDFQGNASVDVSAGDTLLTTLTCTFYATGPNPIGGDNFGDAPSSNRMTISVSGGVTTPTPTPDPIEEPESQPLLGVKLPDIFTAPGSETTNITELTEEELKDLDNFKLDVPGRGSVTFTEGIDFTDGEVITKLHVLDDYIEIGKGFIEVESDNLPQFNTKATVKFEGVELVDGKIEILKDGKDAGSEASNFRYDSGDETLLFDVDGFSRYEIGTGLEATFKKDGDKVMVEGSVSDLNSTLTYSVDGRESATEIEFDKDGEFTLEFTSEEAKESVVITAVGSTGVSKTEELDLTEGTLVDDVAAEENNLGAALVLLLVVVAISAAGFFVVRRRKMMKAKKSGTVETKAPNTDNPQTPL